MIELLNRKKIFFNQLESFYFIGIAGAGMSALAQIIHQDGYQVSGSDLNDGTVVKHLLKEGISISLGHQNDKIKDYDVVVVSSAIRKDNPELLLALAHKKIIISRGELLGTLIRGFIGIAIAGSHGKTTTACLLEAILSKANYDPSYAIGVQPTAAKNNCRLGNSPYFILEVDESDASFLKSNPAFNIITSIDADHLHNYNGKVDILMDSFVGWLNKTPFWGLNFLCKDDKNIDKLLPVLKKPYVTYGYSKQADIVITNLDNKAEYSSFLVSSAKWKKEIIITLPMSGKHNVQNAVAAIALAWHLNISDKVIEQALLTFPGVYRRFQLYNDLPRLPLNTVLIDDYGHHPYELSVTMNTIHSMWPDRRFIMFFQPHRYTRTRALFDDFIMVLSVPYLDKLFLVEEYTANEEYIDGATSCDLSMVIQEKKIVDTQYLLKRDVLSKLQDIVKDGDIVLFQGAGDLSFFIQDLGIEKISYLS